jgi:hypothetical protein
MTKPLQHTKGDNAVGGIVLGEQNSHAWMPRDNQGENPRQSG